MTTAADLIREARTWVGTPYKNGGAVKGAGCNCVTLIARVGMDTGLIPPDWRPAKYVSPQWWMHSNEEAILNELRGSDFCIEVALRAIVTGDVLAFGWDHRPVSHLAFCTATTPSQTMVHAENTVGRVVEHTLAGRWRVGLQTAFRFTALEG